MTAQVVERDKLGVLTKIGQGGQGVVFRAPNVKTKFAASMVYKEYKAPTRAEIDFTALAAMPALVEDSLSYAEGERLVSIAAWPCALVEDAGSPTGFVMPAIPDEFFTSLSTARGVSSTTAEIQHLLNHQSVLDARGLDIDDAQRYSLLREVASGLTFLHKHGVCVGDISPKNLLFSLTPHEAVYFIDCDAMRINGVSALPQMETPGWTAPAGEELATIYTDTYKLGLLALRLLAGDQDTKNPQHLPATTPGLLRQIITDTLNNQPENRPLPEAWTYVLGHAIEEAQHRKETAAAAAAPVSIALDPPPTPVVHSRPSAPAAHSRPPAPPAYLGPPTSPPPPPTWAPPPPTSSKSHVWIGISVAAVVVVALIVFMVTLANRDNSTPSSAPTSSTTEASTYPSYSSSHPTSTTSSWNTPTVSVTPPLVQGPDSYGESCYGYHLPNQSGWATNAGRGTDQTSCQFANNVLLAYWNSYSSPSRDARQVIVASRVSCATVRANASVPVQCSGDNFVITCAVYGNDPWITCTGGNNAKVYLY
jgi:eukaryotic-like serine/threonine-protein kinase